MKKIKKFFQFFLPRNWSISSQITIIICFIFIVFLVLQVAITNRIFNNYFLLKQRNYFSDLTAETVDRIKANDESIFEGIYELNSQYGVFPILLDENFSVLDTYDDYVIYLTNKSEKYIVPNVYYHYSVGQEVNIRYQLDKNDHNNKRVISVTITSGEETITNNYDFVEGESIYSTGTSKIEGITPPENLNNRFRTALIMNSLESMDKDKISFKDNEYIYIIEESETLTIMIILNQVSDTRVLATVIPVNESQDLLHTLNLYNGYIYFLVGFVIIFVSIVTANMIRNSITDLSVVANEVANQNFKIEKINYGNKEIKNLSESIYRIAENLSSQISKLNKQKEEIENLSFEQNEKYEVRKNLVAAMSHELKTPLFVIQTTINAIQDDLFSKKQTKSELENINQEITKCSKMIEEILNIYSIDNKNLDLTYEPFDIISLSKEIIKNFAGNYKSKKLQIHLIKNKEEIEIYANLKQFTRVLNNLILNAMKYTPDNNKIEIEVLDFDDKIVYTVSNYGVSIPEKDLQFIFDAFYRVDKSGNKKDKIGGSGLGLYIAKEILNTHKFPHRFFNIENGVCFEIIIPKSI